MGVMTPSERAAFGQPGSPPTWSSSAKDRIITALGSSRLWATLGHGILNEVYWPATGQPQTRDLGFIIGGDGYWVEVKRQRSYTLRTPKPFIPLPEVVHTGDRYRLSLEFLPDPFRDVLLIRTRLEGDGLRVYPLLAPHLGMSGWNNRAWVDAGLYAQSGGGALCLLSDPPFARASAGYVGQSDGWQDFARNGRMSWTFEHAADGNVALMAELSADDVVLALALSETPEGARTLARSSLAQGYEQVREHFVAGWEDWGARLHLPGPSRAIEEEAQLSASVLRMHADRTYPGAIVASLSIPWGNASNDLGGYHLVWTRDAVEAGLGFLAVGQVEDVVHLLAYLAATQNADGGWSQNFYPDGRPYWSGIQLDEVGLPILLAAKAHELGLGDRPAVAAMASRAAAYLAQRGPVSPQDRWEETAGMSPFTLGLEIVGLVAAATYYLQDTDRDYALALADCWNERIEEWTYVNDTDVSRQHGVDGYYVRVNPPPEVGWRGRVAGQHRPEVIAPAAPLVGLDFIYLARLGLRAPDDPRMIASLKVADALLRVSTLSGLAYRRYVGDRYGEHPDGSPFDGSGIGRAWPLLTGERGIMALLQGEDPLPYLEAMCSMASRFGLIPEQVWDSDPIPQRGLSRGGPTGSAMPLVWAHAEFLKLLLAREHGRPLERLNAVWDRYRRRPPKAAVWYWRDQVPFDDLPPGRALVVEAAQPFRLHVGVDGWRDAADHASTPLGLGMHGVLIDTTKLNGFHELNFTCFYPADNCWDGVDYSVRLT